jgi:hypothetical protein
MKRVTLLLLFLLAAPAAAQIDPTWAVVKIPSHGCSGCVIASNSARTLILTCSHAFKYMGTEQLDPALLARPIRLYACAQGGLTYQGPRPVKLVKISGPLDLSLIELANGPLYAVPVAPPGTPHPPLCWSCGHDEMHWPALKKPATVLSTGSMTTFTVEKPWHGRSGGGLYSTDGRYLWGIVQGYEGGPGGRGRYVSHQAILSFLAGYQPGVQAPVLPPLLQIKLTPPVPYHGGPPACPT